MALMLHQSRYLIAFQFSYYFGVGWYDKWIMFVFRTGKCCWRSLCHLPGEDACSNLTAVQTYLLWRLCFRMVIHIFHLATLFILLTLISYDGLFVYGFYFISFTFQQFVQIGNREYRKYFLFTLLPSLVCVTYVLIILVLVTLSGLKEKGLALYAGPWLGQLIYGHLGTDQQACLSRCSKFFFFFFFPVWFVGGRTPLCCGSKLFIWIVKWPPTSFVGVLSDTYSRLEASWFQWMRDVFDSVVHHFTGRHSCGM